MVAQAACPELDVIRDLLCGKLPETEQEHLASHFDHCSGCRLRFEKEAASPKFLGDVSQLCGTTEWQPDTASLGWLLQDMPQQLSTAADAASIVAWSTDAVTGFFAPSEHPEHLGRLDCYEIIEVIGRGGMGIVLRGIDTKLNRVVAIKVLAPELASNPNARRRFFREGQAAAAVSDDHVVTIHAVDDSERLPYLVMEFIEGESLEECVRRNGSLTIEQILRIGRQTALGLAAAHEVGLVHRDMKPANILLENGLQRVRITDFGLARAVDDVGLTQTGTVSGTPLYMSPEQAVDDNIDHRSDLFSLGSVLYTMCTGRPAFRANSAVAVLKRVCEDTPRPIRDVNPEIPQWLADVVDRLIAKQPADRIQSTQEVAELFGQHLAHLQNPDAVAFPAAAPIAGAKAASGPRRLLLLMALVSLVTFGMSEAVGLTEVGKSFMGIILKLTTKDGTLIVEIDDPNVAVTVDGDELVVEGVGTHEIRLKPGKHQFTEIREGVAQRQDWVTIESGGKRVLRVRQVSAKSVRTKDIDSPANVSVPKKGVPSSSSPDDDIEYQLAIDGIAFEHKMDIQRFGTQEVINTPGIGELIFPKVPEQLYAQRCAMAEVEGGLLRFRVQNRTFADDFQFISDRQRLWLLIPEAGWNAGASDNGITYDTAESLAKRNWHAWGTLTSYPATTDPNEESHHVRWAVFHRECSNENIAVRIHPDHTPMLVWGSLQLSNAVVDTQWDQRVSLFNPGASVSLGNGHHIFDEVPGFLAGRLYTKRNGYQGLVHFRVDRDQRVFVAMYDWRHMNDGSGGLWQDELTPPDMLKRTGWEEVATLEPRHTHPSGEAKWHVYARDCERGESFKLRSHKYQAPIVFSEKINDSIIPAAENLDVHSNDAAELEQKIANAVGEFNRLLQKHRYAESLVLAKQAMELAPDHTACIAMLQRARQAVQISGNDHAVAGPDSHSTAEKSVSAIKLDNTQITTQIARSVAEPAVFGVGSGVTPIRDFPAYFEARARGQHPDGARKLIGQIAAAVQHGDTIVVKRFDRVGPTITLHLRHEADARIRSEGNAEPQTQNFDPLEEARRLSIRYEKARAEQPERMQPQEWLLIIAQHMIARADLEPNANEVRKLRDQARERVRNAHQLFAIDVASNQAALEAFPVFIDPEAAPNLLRQKKQVELRLVASQLQLATCTMVDALSHRPQSKEWMSRLLTAASEFESLHRKYRTRLGGLYARVRQARCLQHLGQSDAALEIYREVLAHPAAADAILRIQNRALLFRLIVLNDERRDWNGVLRETSDWLANAPPEHRRTRTGAAILWEEARAMQGQGDDPPTRLNPELMGDGNGELILRATLKLLKQTQQSGGKHSELAAKRIPQVLTLLTTRGATTEDAGGRSVYFQVPLPDMPVGSYEVHVSLESAGADEIPAIVSGCFTVPPSHTTGSQLTLLTTHAIVMEPSPEKSGLTSGTQTPHGLDLAAILRSTNQQALVESFPTDHAQFENACHALRQKGANWALCAVLEHANVDAKIHAARALAGMADADTVSVLLAAAKRNNYGVDGSESATLHSIWRQELRKALEAATGLTLTPDSLYYMTPENGTSTRITSKERPELFPESVEFKSVDKWLREVYLPNRGEKVPPLIFDAGDFGLIGRATVDGRDGGTIFHYPNGRFFAHDDIPPQIHDSRSFTVKLEGYLVVPQDMFVKVWHGGGGVSHDVNWLYIDGREISVVGDDHSKHFVAEIPMLKGVHQIRWELTGGTFRTNILAFIDPDSGALMKFLNSGIANLRQSADERVIHINRTEPGWPITNLDWLPPAVEVTEPTTPETPNADF